MNELPENQTLSRQIRETLLGRRITHLLERKSGDHGETLTKDKYLTYISKEK